MLHTVRGSCLNQGFTLLLLNLWLEGRLNGENSVDILREFGKDLRDAVEISFDEADVLFARQDLSASRLYVASESEHVEREVSLRLQQC